MTPYPTEADRQGLLRGLRIALPAGVVLWGIIIAAGYALAEDVQHQHPAVGQHDPYAGLHLRNDGKKVNCCSSRDCRPVEARFNFEAGQTEILLRTEWRVLDYDKVVGPPPPGADQHMIHACWQDYMVGPGPILCLFVSGSV